MCLYVFWGLSGGAWLFVLKLRAIRLAGLLTCAAAIAVATILFQTVAANRVITPWIMGFDRLYILLQSLMVAMLGISAATSMPVALKFTGETALMVLFSVILFSTLLGRGSRDIDRMILTGVILGVLFRSLSNLVGRMLDPNDYAIVQMSSYASFSQIDAGLLPWAAAMALGACGAALWLAPQLDVLALGRTVAIPLGLPHQRLVVLTLSLVALLVSVSVALVGPMVFAGLVVSSLAYAVMPLSRHGLVLPAAILVSVILFVAGQTVFERLMGMQATLSVVIELVGGLLFLWLLLRGRLR